MKVRLVRHDGSNWYGDAEIGNEYEIVKVNERTYTIKMDDKFSVGLDKDHCEIISPLPQEILTEEELKERNRLLVLENDELLAENMKYKKGLFDAYDFIFTELAIPKHYREKFYRILLIDCNLDPNIRKLEEIIHE